MKNLIIKDLHVEIEGKEILKGVNLTINDNEIHALMGPNGNGKSTLLSTIMGHPKYIVTKGSISFNGEDVLSLDVDERSKLGLFIGMQYPQEIPGVTNSDFLKAAINARRESPISLFEFIKSIETSIKELKMNPDLAHRFLNEGFSGGEKKRNEILQMKLLKPALAMLDEIDSGLDVDALKLVADAIHNMRKEYEFPLIIISHYDRFYDLITPSKTHIMIDGKIVKEGDFSLAKEIDTKGYDWIYKELDIKPIEEKKKIVSIGSCAVRKD